MNTNKAVTLSQIKMLYDSIKSGAASYESVSDMKADASLSKGQLCSTGGYYTNGDGGAGVYVIVDRVADDGGLYHDIDNGLSAKLIPEDDVIYAAQYGVKIDSSSDDADAMNRFLALAALKTYKLHVKPATGKRMKITKPLIINGGNVARQGEIDFGGIELFYNGAENTPFLVIADIQNETIRNLNTNWECTSGSQIWIMDALRINLENIHANRMHLRLSGNGGEYYTEKRGVVCYINVYRSEFATLTVDEFESENGYTNCLNFYDCAITSPRVSGYGIYDYTVDLKHRVEGLSFINCDISYAKKAKFRVPQEPPSSTITMINCYYDGHEPMVETNQWGYVAFASVGSFNGQNTPYVPIMDATAFSRVTEVGTFGKSPTLIPMSHVNYAKNGDFANIALDENGRIPGIGWLNNATAQPAEDALNRSGNAVRLTFGNSQSDPAQVYFLINDAPSSGTYTAGIKFIKRSGENGTLSVAISNDRFSSYSPSRVEIGDLQNDVEYIITVTTGRDDFAVAGDPMRFQMYTSGSTGFMADVREISFTHGTTYMSGLMTLEECHALARLAAGN